MMRTIGIPVAGLLVFLCSIPHSFAAPQGEGAQTPTFRASSQLVLLDVVVTDKGGNPVAGLGMEDFSVKEDGKPQKIAFLTPPESVPASTAPPALPDGVYSNAPVYRLTGAFPTAIVLDAANTPYKDQLYAGRQMLKFLKDQYKPGQKIAIFAVTDKLSLLQDFTGDPEVLRACLESFNASETVVSEIQKDSPPDLEMLRVSTQEYRALKDAFQQFQTSEVQYAADRRTDVTLDAMRRITRILGGLPGRKNLIWLTGGFPFTLNPNLSNSAKSDLSELFQHSGGLSSPVVHDTPTSLQYNAQYGDTIRQISAEMASSQVAIYPVDVRGLMISRASDAGDQQETMREIAWETGGRAFVNRNDVDASVALALRDRTATYTLGYYPLNKNRDHEYRTIDLKLKRAGLETTYRHGYFVVDPSQHKNTKPEKELAAAWQDRAPYSLVSFEAKVSAIGNGKARVEFLVNANSLSVEESSSGKKFDVGFYVAACSSEGKVFGVQGTKLARDFPPNVYQKILQEGMRIHMDADLPPGTAVLRLAVMDNRTGYLGTLNAASPAKDKN